MKKIRKVKVWDARWVHELASPGGELHEVFRPLWRVPPRSIRAALAEKHEDDTCDRTVKAARSLPDRELTQVARATPQLGKVLDNFDQRLPQRWVELMRWAHWVAMSLIPPEMPALRHAFEALIEHEPQLHVAPYYPNRDHLVHQIADAGLALDLHRRGRERRPRYDDVDWRLLCEVVPGLTEANRVEVTEAGLALAGLTHDIGYLRYIGAAARERLSNIFGVSVPAPGVEPNDLLRIFSGTLVENMLTRPRQAVDGLVVDLYQAAWKRGLHGPLAAMVIASVARGLRLEGRSVPVIDGILQVAASAAFLHELHPTKESEENPNRPLAVREARRCVRRYRWPALFRIVDDMQCWFRPELRAEVASLGQLDRTEMDLGAKRVELRRGVIRIIRGRPRRGGDHRGSDEADGLNYLRNYLAKGSQAALFETLGIESVESIDESEAAREP